MEEMELREYWDMIRRHWLIVILIPIIAALTTGVVSFFVITPQYEAHTTILVNQQPNSNQSLQYDSIMANQALVNTYSAIIKSDSIENAVIQELNLPYTTNQLNKMIAVSSPTQSQVIDVLVTNTNHPQTADIANALTQVFQERAQSLMDIQNIQIVDEATVQQTPYPVKPNKKLNIAIAFILGLMFSIGLSFLLEYMDNHIRTGDDVSRYLDLPLLGVVLEHKD